MGQKDFDGRPVGQRRACMSQALPGDAPEDVCVRRLGLVAVSRLIGEVGRVLRFADERVEHPLKDLRAASLQGRLDPLRTQDPLGTRLHPV